jgi:acetolactate synthase-1/2/3 large subunit
MDVAAITKTAVARMQTPSENNPATQSLTCGDLIVQYLLDLDVTRIFGVPGGSIEPFWDAVARAERHTALRMIVARHETGAAFMADGYVREGNPIGVCCSTTGPGATNLFTGVASAYAEAVPMLVITAQTPLLKFGRETLQDSSCAGVDIVAMMGQCTKYSTLVSHPDQLESKLIKALVTARQGKPGPVHLSIPADILNMPAPRSRGASRRLLRQVFNYDDAEALSELQHLLLKSSRVAVYMGDRCGSAAAGIMGLAEQLNAAVVTDPVGKAWVDETHPLYHGVFGFSGHASARKLIAEQSYDLLLVVGASLGELGTSGWDGCLLNDKVVHIDEIAEHFERSQNARLHVFGRLQTVVDKLGRAVAALSSTGKRWEPCAPAAQLLGSEAQAKALSDAVPIKPQRAFTQLAQQLPAETRIFVDAGNAWTWATHYLRRRESSGYYRIAMSYGSMTWAIGASVGSAVANPGAPHLCITGDGSYLMAGQEITVALQQQIPLVMVVLNDNALGMVKHGQRLGGAEQHGFELPAINYAAMAEAMGVEGIVVDSPQALAAVDFPRLFAKCQPTLIDLRIDPEEVPPMGERIKGLATSKR